MLSRLIRISSRLFRPFVHFFGLILKIAQRFSAGWMGINPPSPEGTIETSFVPMGLFYFVGTFYPAINGWAIFKKTRSRLIVIHCLHRGDRIGRAAFTRV